MLPDNYVATTRGCKGSGRLKLENGLAVLANTTIEILQKRKSKEFYFYFLFDKISCKKIKTSDNSWSLVKPYLQTQKCIIKSFKSVLVCDN